MKRYYANLLGNWVDITEEGTVENHQHVPTFFEERLEYLNGGKISEYFKYDYINIQYKGKNYRIHPAFIQIVSG